MQYFVVYSFEIVCTTFLQQLADKGECIEIYFWEKVQVFRNVGDHKQHKVVRLA